MPKLRTTLIAAMLLFLIALLIDLSGYLWSANVDLTRFKIPFKRDLSLRYGLDLQGGLQVVLEADMSDVPEGDRDQALESARSVIARRVDFLGVSEPVIQVSRSGDSYRVIVELPGVTDPEQALLLIGQTAQLDFRESSDEAGAGGEGFTFISTGLTGADLSRAEVGFDSSTGKPYVALSFTPEGAEKFAEITERNVGGPLAIYLDEVLLTAPTVQEKIIGGSAVISGDFTLEEARRVTAQLNAGALPTPIKVLERRQVGATLGTETVRKSVIAGLVGLGLVVFFMIGNYGRLGIIATAALVIYGVLTLAIYKLLPVTLTLSGIAGFILSVGMAVDSNILIFERIKEEKRWGKEPSEAMELGFGRAWDSIRDANVATLATVFVLFNPLNWSFLVTSGIVRGFALTLGLGVLISLFTGVLVTRTLVRAFYR
jgi:preprotein translocase subunit SecD